MRKRHLSITMLFVTLTMLPLLAQDGGTWTELDTIMPTARSEMPGAELDGLLYTAGGFISGGVSDALEAYDPLADEWAQFAPMPEARHHLMMTAHDGYLYVFGGGGTGAMLWQPHDNAWRYSPEADEWEVLTAMPEARMSAAAVTLDDYVYVIGGVGPTYDLLRYDPAEDEWERLGALNYPTEHNAAVVLDGVIYLLGGRWQRTAFDDVETYDPETDTWEAAPPMNEPRSGFSAAVIDGKIITGGGEILSAPPVLLDTAEIYDPQTETWAYIEPLPTGIHGLPTLAYEGRVYILGGSERAAAISNSGRMMVYTPVEIAEDSE
jgi:N-acetylneuraminic acid mutarotase